MKELVQLLIKEGKTISTMESCTGGAIANAITNIPDASKVFSFSAVTYSNEYKIKMGVSKEIINKYTVYSSETAINMAMNISLYTNSDYGVGVTGKLMKKDLNNLTGDDNAVFIAIYDKESDISYCKRIFVSKKRREENKTFIVNVFCQYLKEIMENK